jgi:leucyl-tRNA synthetase
VLANEEVIGGLSERGQHPVVRLPLKQWMLRITAYGDRLESGLDTVQWPDSIKKLQRDWIGRSTGAEVDFYIGDATQYDAWKEARAKSGFTKKPSADVLRIYTTRPDTLFGATYMVIAPEHPAVKSLTTPEQKSAVETYVQQASFKSDLDRTELAKVKSGVFTGSYALNPVNGAKVPVWIADYVLISYGTGAIMAVPAHDERDFEFAKVYDLPIIPVVDPAGESKERDALLAGTAAFIADGTAINSGSYNGLSTSEMKTKITADLATGGFGRQAINYKLRDWLFSRQRFWGEPFPILHEVDAQGNFVGNMRAVPVEQLPVNLPELADFKPHGRPEPPLEKAPADWLYVTLEGKRYKRETNTMPQWAGSCWYFLRYIDPQNDKLMIDPALEKAWMPVDLYIGGAEHAVLHLLYSRFWHMVLFDRGHVTLSEPFMKLVNQGMILGEAEYHIAPTAYQTSKERIAGLGIEAKHIVPKDEGDKETVILKVPAANEPGKFVNLTEDFVEKKAGKTLIRGTDLELTSLSEKMSKSRGNVVNPDTIVKEFGADSLRLYEMFMGPLEATKPWSSNGVNGVRGFLDRCWRLITNEKNEVAVELHPTIVRDAPTDDQQRVIHKTVAAVTNDIEKLSFNTAIAKLMEYVNYFTKLDRRPIEACEKLVLLLSPFAPHIAEELWQILGHSGTLAYEPWPVAEAKWLKDDTIEVPVQVNGKLRAKLTVAADLKTDALEAAAREDSRIAELLEGKTVVKVICVPGKLVNFVVK